MALHQLPATLRTTCPRQLRNRSGDSHLTGGPIDVGTGLSLGWTVDWQWKWRTPPRDRRDTGCLRKSLVKIR